MKELYFINVKYKITHLREKYNWDIKDILAELCHAQAESKLTPKEYDLLCEFVDPEELYMDPIELYYVDHHECRELYDYICKVYEQSKEVEKYEME